MAPRLRNRARRTDSVRLFRDRQIVPRRRRGRHHCRHSAILAAPPDKSGRRVRHAWRSGCCFQAGIFAGINIAMLRGEQNHFEVGAHVAHVAQVPGVGIRLARRREHVAGAPPLNLPLDHPRPPQQRIRRSNVPVELDAQTGSRLRAAARDHGATLFALVVSAYAYWLRSYSEQDDIVFATVLDRGREAGSAGVQECGPTSLLLRVHVPEAVTCTELLTTVRAELLDSIRYAVPVEQSVAAVNPAREERLNPVFQAALLLDPAMLRADPAPLERRWEAAYGAMVADSMVDVSVVLRECADGRIDGRLTYDADLFEAGTARLMRDHFVGLLKGIAAAPELRLSDLSAPGAADRHAQIVTFNPVPLPAATAVDDRCIHELIADRAACSPDRTALVVGAQRLSYRQLLDRSQHIAARLTEAGAGPGAIVAISSIDRSTWFQRCSGSLMCGAAYLPLDPHQPESRSLFMMADAGATVLLTDSPHRLGSVPPDVDVVDLARAATPTPGDAAPACTVGHGTPADLAYVIYTSGSTGQPKGVQVEHRSVVNLMATLPVALGLFGRRRTRRRWCRTLSTGRSATYSARSVWAPHWCLPPLPRPLIRAQLAALVERSGATAMSATPTTWSMLISAGWAGRPGFLAVCAGEPLPDLLAEQVAARCRARMERLGAHRGARCSPVADSWRPASRSLSADHCPVSGSM